MIITRVVGGGAPTCPCTYLIQVFDNTPTSRSGKTDCVINFNQTFISYILLNKISY